MINRNIARERVHQGKVRAITRSRRSGYAIYGPYERRPRGCYRVAFILCVLPGLRAVPDQVCATLEVVDADADVILAKRYVQSSELIAQPCVLS